MEQPVIKIERSKADVLLELTAFVAMAAMIVLSLYYYNKLPDQIPVHFNAAGQADSFDSKNMIFFLPTISILLYAGLSVLNRNPHIFNYPVKVTSENAAPLYKIATRSVRVFKAIIMVSFLYLTFRMIDNGLNGTTGIGVLFMPVLIISIIVALIIMIRKMMKY